jgi:thiol-disulfide isomerase/thioredoxin
LNSLLHV